MPGKRLLLHACCAPCSSAIIECLVNQGIRPVIFYSNSNIFPLDEYDHRKNECIRYAAETGLEIVNDRYAHDEWRCIARGLEHEPEKGVRCTECFKFRLERAARYAQEHDFDVIRYAAETGLEIVNDRYAHDEWRCIARGLEHEPEKGVRCTECFKFRLERAARYAQEHDFDVLATTLASSRWKNIDQVNAAGSYACGLFPSVTWWAMNWRKGGLQERRNEIIREHGFYNQLYCGCEFSMASAGKPVGPESGH